MSKTPLTAAKRGLTLHPMSSEPQAHRARQGNGNPTSQADAPLDFYRNQEVYNQSAMNNDLLELLNRLSPSNHRLAREMIQRLAQLEQLATPADHDARLHYHTYVTPWLQHLLAQGMSTQTLRTYAGRIQHLLQNYPHPKRSHLEAMLASLAAQGRTPGTIAAHINAHRSFFDYLADRDIITTNPAAKLHRPRLPLTPREPATAEQVNTLLTAPSSTRHRLMLYLLADTGIRVNELATLPIPHTTTNITVHGKGDKTRYLPLSPPSTAILTAHLAELTEAHYTGPWLFPGQCPSPHITTDAIRRYLRDLCKRTNLPRITPHQFRHYFATQMLSHGANLKATSAILGHAQTATTANIYWHIIDKDEIIQQHARFSPLKGALCQEQK